MSIQAVAAVLELPASVAGARRLVLISLANHANDRSECWPSIDTIGREAALSRDTVRRAIRSLEADGLISRRVNAAPDGRIPADKRPNLYRLGPWSIRGGAKSSPPEPRGGANPSPRGGESVLTGGAESSPLTVREPLENRGDGGADYAANVAAVRDIRRRRRERPI